MSTNRMLQINSEDEASVAQARLCWRLANLARLDGTVCEQTQQEAAEPMTFFPFKTHVLSHSNERGCIQDVRTMLDRVAVTIDRHLAAARERYNRACCNAAYAMAALEEHKSQRLSQRVDKLTAAIDLEATRLAELERQAKLVKQLRAVVDSAEKRQAVARQVTSKRKIYPPFGVTPLSFRIAAPSID